MRQTTTTLILDVWGVIFSFLIAKRFPRRKTEKYPVALERLKAYLAFRSICKDCNIVAERFGFEHCEFLLIRSVKRGEEEAVRFFLSKPRINALVSRGGRPGWCIRYSKKTNQNIYHLFQSHPSFSSYVQRKTVHPIDWFWYRNQHERDLLLRWDSQIERGEEDLVRTEMEDPTFDPSRKDNLLIRGALKENRLEVVKLLISHPKFRPKEGRQFGCTCALHIKEVDSTSLFGFSRSNEAVDILLSRDIPMNAWFVKQMVWNGNCEVVKAFFEKRPFNMNECPEYFNSYGCLILTSIKANHLDMVKLIVESNVGVRLWDAVIVAMHFGSVEIVQYLIDMYNNSVEIGSKIKLLEGEEKQELLEETPYLQTFQNLLILKTSKSIEIFTEGKGYVRGGFFPWMNQDKISKKRILERYPIGVSSVK